MRASWQLCALLLSFHASVQIDSAHGAIDAPIIGILSVPLNERQSYIPASYVKWLESGGARVIPITLGMSENQIHSLIDQLNGVLLTGGAANFSYSDDSRQGYYWSSVNWILDYLREIAENSNGEKSVPLWGSCLGFEAVLSAVAKAGPSTMVTDLDAYSLPRNISFTAAATSDDSAIFGSESPMNSGYRRYSFESFANENASFNDHQNGFLPRTLSEDPYLRGNFTLLGTSFDRNGVEFATLVQSRSDVDSPLHWYLSQFHPEKSPFVFDAGATSNLPHSLAAVLANEYLAQFFVNDCRHSNDHSMESSVYWDRVIYNYHPVFTSRIYQNTSHFEQVYLFPY